MGIFKNISLQQLWRGAVTTFLAYPLVLLSAFAGTAAAIFNSELSYDQRQEHLYLEKFMLVCALGLILFFTLELLVSKYKLRLHWQASLWLAGLVLLVLYFWLLPLELEQRHWLRFLMLALALHLAASYAMFLNRRDENAFWQFNKALFLRILTSALYSGVLFIGLVIAVLAMEELFSVDIDGAFYGQLWLFMVGVFNTWFFLAGVPTDVQELEHTHLYPKGLKVFTQFVLLPLVTLYLLILYAYFGKIIAQWAWPEGWVSVLVLCFSIAGILSLLLIHPIRFEEGNTWMRTFSRWFYRALFPLIILLALAIWRRVSEYGVTEERYVVMALALWLFITALYFLFSRQKNIKFIPITLSVVALLAAFGPFSAFQVSEWSQVNRLEKLLQESKVLVNGQIQRQHPPVSGEVEEEVSSITDYLARTHGFEALQPWFAIDLEDSLAAATDSLGNRWQKSFATRDKVLDLMGLEYNSGQRDMGRQHFYFSTQHSGSGNAVQDIRGYAYAVQYSYRTFERHEEQREFQLGAVPMIVSLEKEGSVLYFKFEQETLTLDLLPLIKKLQKKQHELVSPADMTLTVEGKQVKVKLALDELNGVEETKEGNYRVQSIEASIYVQLQE
ncbi:DUF4153 domain-containing protein [Pontibacter akesuensis]|uniref:DUF4153 domain-containing protein n=1 Tax=Pontibacter akesuensis TaxID=388950 RepID=A0A1I7K002_9BACT|nr:DUF4153 domain-containing protein [Pontibacter akesuensis]GHA76153.1 hypothetical protein GCM10007389_32620 [Pontibacter akesuensis]SFU90747.1 protein of unknown function [Pontibacter akesuensis]